MKKILLLIAMLLCQISIAQAYFTDTKGELQISDAGSASYTIPIALPPSIKNYAPNINLIYTSGKRGGIAGQGWEVSGISSISRIASRRDIDGFFDGVDFDNNDKLALDGQRLLIKTGNYWENNSTYQTEFKSNLKIELQIQSSKTYFIVTNVDGTRTWYGSTGNGIPQNYVSVNSWYIVRSEDVYGNYITYNYDPVEYNGVTQLYVSDIMFSGNEPQSLTQLNRIEFHYMPAKKVEKDYMNGHVIYASQVLDWVGVKTGSDYFRKYKMTRSIEAYSQYERVTQVQEFSGINGMDEPSNPVTFEYYETPLDGHRDAKWYPNILYFNDVKLSGDFDGDGRLDFVADNYLYTKLYDNNYGGIMTPMPTEMKFAATTLKNNKINQFQSLVNYSLSGGANLSFNIYSYNPTTSSINLDYTKSFPNQSFETITVVNPGPASNPGPCGVSRSIGMPATVQFTGDFNGDGITEVIYSQHSCTRTYTVQDIVTPHHSYEDCIETSAVCSSDTFFLADLNPNSPDTVKLLNDWGWIFPSYRNYTQNWVNDYNGDGRADIMRIYDNTKFTIATIVDTDIYPYYRMEKIGSGNLDEFSTLKQTLFGDFNGDGKTDIMIPNDVGGPLQKYWYIYYGTGDATPDNFFDKVGMDTDVEYWPYHSDSGFQNIKTYYAMDANKDGKSDVVVIERMRFNAAGSWDGVNTLWAVASFTNNLGVRNGPGFTLSSYSGNIENNSPDLPTPVVASYTYHGNNTDIVMARGHSNWIDYYTFNKNFDSDNRLKTVTESDGHIKHTIEYKPMQADDGGLGNPATDFYSSANNANYPEVEIIKNPTTFLVSKLTATVNGASKIQKFRYRGYSASFNYGNIGFTRTARCGWYLSDSDTKIWTVKNNDIEKRGANNITWTCTSDATVFDPIPSDLLSTTTNSFSTYKDNNTGVFNLLLDDQSTKDWQTKVTITNHYQYDGTVQSPNYFGLQTECVTRYYSGTKLQGMTTTLNKKVDGSPGYDWNLNGGGNAYYVGRPLRSEVTKVIYDASGTAYDTRKSEIVYSYSPGPDVSKIETKGHNTDAIIEEFTYSPFGNLIQKKTSMPTSDPPVADRTIYDDYDPATQRFVIKKTDHQGFITLLEYNAFGQVKKSTDYMGVIKEFGFDNWGKLTQSVTTHASTTALQTNFFYYKLQDGGYYTKTFDNTGSENFTYYDVLGRMTKTKAKGFASGSYIWAYREYDALGRLHRESEPSFSEPQRWAKTYHYDFLSRPDKITYANTREQTLDYFELTSTVADSGGQTTATTIDAMGNKIKASDLGGDIEYTYFASGQLMKTKVGEHEITNDIDGWGNKILTNDPNAGTYTYTYDGFGEMTLETTPTGSTEYTYVNGLLTHKKVSGAGADFETSYTYNSFEQLENEITETSGHVPVDTYHYTYDALHRLEATTETSAVIEHSKAIVFDNFSRAETETNTTKEKVSGTDFTSTVVNKYVYSAYNGMLYKIANADDTALWELNTANEMMQALTATLGNGVTITNAYTDNHQLQSQRHKKNAVDVMFNTNTYNGVRGLLTQRQNITLGITETFDYDPQDRLWQWYLNGVEGHNGYDGKGRITYNDKVGDIKYNEDANTGIYRKASAKFNGSGTAYYGNLGGSQTVSYTMFKAPIAINESNKGKISFEYNSHLSRTRMDYDYGLIAPNPVREKRKTKLYTDDGSTEVIIDNNAHTVTINTFIGGDAYSAPVYNTVSKDLVTGIPVDDAKYYLHRDYLGSILAISNEAGLAVEQRHFDAWGNLTKIVGANGPLALSDGLKFLDRGYTSHEHLHEVRLIHMNGRLYDPLLRGFLMPDNFVQAPNNTQSYNRYAYCMNNPLSYSDSSGEYWEGLGIAVAIGVVISAITYTATAYFSGTPFTAGGFFKSVAIGALSAAVTYSIGSACDSLFAESFYLRAGVQALAHGTFQGGLSAATGGSFWSGFAAGAVSSLAMSAWSGGDSSSYYECVDRTFTTSHQGISGALGASNSVAAGVAFGAVMGGVGAELTGGNFWVGAATGLVVSGLNHAMHEMDDNDDIVRINSKDKTATVERTGDNYDRVFIDGQEIAATTRGLLADGLKEMGYSISMKGPQGVGMGLTDAALEWFGGTRLLKGGRYLFSLKFGERVFNSKSFGYASELFGRYHKTHLPDGVKGTLNSGYLRNGWSNFNSTHVFRTSIGHIPNNRHIDWFYKY